MKRIASYLTAFVVTCFFISCTSHPVEVAKETKAVPDSIVNHVQTARVKLEEEDDFIRLNGKVEPNETRQAKVFALVSGKIESVNVELGDFVKKGQLLAVLNSIEVAEVSNNLSLAESNVTIARKNLETTKDLYEGRLATEQEYLNADISFKKAISELNRAGQVASITGGNSSSYMVRAPIDGFIIEKNITSNSEVRQDNNTDLFAIADLSNVWVIANVYESDMNKVHLNDAVVVKTLANPEKTYIGKINKIYNVLDPDTRTMRIRVSMDNQDHELKPEMFATVRVNIKSSGNGMAIPSRAIVMDNSKYYVVVRSAGKLEVKKVVILKRVGDRTFISGLDLDEEVVTNSQVFLYQALNTN